MRKQRYNLIELAADLSTSVEELIGYGADSELTLYVIADKWPGKKTGNSDAKSAVIVDGQAELLPNDLLKSLNSDSTEVRQVKTKDGGVVFLDSPLKVMRGVHFVTAAERDRVTNALEQTLQPTETAAEGASLPYLDPAHHWYSETLEAAVSAWMALYANGGFKKKSLGHKAQIESWLRKHRPDLRSDYARKGIAKVVNPNEKGGNPITKKD